jgi:hypothetical protein
VLEWLIHVTKEGFFVHGLKFWKFTINVCQKTHFYAASTDFQLCISPSFASPGKTDWDLKYFFSQFKSRHVFLQLRAKFETNPCLLTAWFAKQFGKETQMDEQAGSLGTAAVPHSVLH